MIKLAQQRLVNGNLNQRLAASCFLGDSAILNGMTPVVDQLLKLGASKYTEDAFNANAEAHAGVQRDPEISKLLAKARS